MLGFLPQMSKKFWPQIYYLCDRTLGIAFSKNRKFPIFETALLPRLLLRVGSAMRTRTVGLLGDVTGTPNSMILITRQ